MKPRSPRSILVVSASTGTGHKRAGDAVTEALLEKDPGVDVQHIDLLDLAPTWVRAAYGTGYELIASRTPWLWHQIYRRTDGDTPDRAIWSPMAQRLLFRGFRALLASRPWSACLCTHFLPAQLAARMRGAPPFALAITDFTLHRFWVQPGVRRYFVGTEQLARDLRRRVPGARVRVTGIPIAPAFSRAPSSAVARAELGFATDRMLALVMGGGLGLGILETTLAALEAAGENLQVVAICGRNEIARQALRRLGIASERLRVEGYVQRVERYIAAADFVVTKPGGLTCSESLALGRPLVLTRPIPGQETGNSRAISALGAALAASEPREIRSAIQSLITDPGLLHRMAGAARRLGRPRAAELVAEIALRDPTRHAPASTPALAPPRMGATT